MAKGAKSLHFVKMESSGNDCLIVEALAVKAGDFTRFFRKVLHRRTGVGADQAILYSKSRKADFKARIFNSDGSEAEMCGNGIRCLANFLREAKLTGKREIEIETLAGIRQTKVTAKSVSVNLGEPKLKGKEIPVRLSGRIINRPLRIESKDFRITCLSLGNPHCIIFQENLDAFPVEKFGPLIEHHQIFPNRVNVSFANVLSTGHIQVRFWERGAGETLSCGTGSAASLIASVLNGYTDRAAKVESRGGKLDVEWNKETNSVWLAGPVETICEGNYLL